MRAAFRPRGDATPLAAADADVLGPALEATAREGFALVRAALDDFVRRALVREARDARLAPSPREVGKVRQETEALHGHLDAAGDTAGLPRAAALARELGRRVREAGGPGLEGWHPNELDLQRYPPGSLGITSHRDGRRYALLVAAFSLAGHARLWLRERRHEGGIARLALAPGDLLLLRGPGLGGHADGRLFHAVEPAGSEPRLSLALRMDTRRGGR